ncbi:hypothetical protein ACHQM5_008609 [Ranunculus cassubicifolius]
MKFEDSSLSGYLVKNLQPLTEADPVILAEYVAALLKKDKSIDELQKLCAEKLVEFLGQGTQPFITKLFQALEDGSVVAPPSSLDATVQVEASPSVIKEDPAEVKNPALNSEVPGSPSDPDEKEVSDDDDDDRNHKHRRRETRPHSFDKDTQGQSFRRTNKRYKPSENGQAFFRNDPQSSENHKEYNPASLERRRPGHVPFPRTAYDFGHRNRVNQAFHIDPSQFDLSTSLGRLPTGRGRGRGTGAWNPHDMNFSPIDTLDFASQMPPQGPNHNGVFAGRGLQPFGMIPGMPNGGLDTIHPLGMQGALGPQMNQSMGIGISRQRCRDFEERGFCLRGDMCPMEHGVNRIVVEDVQSLSQFNLPVSIPSAHLLGTAHMGSAPSNLQTNTKTSSKNNKHGTENDGFSSNRAPVASSGAGEADLYDPDQPLWNNDHLSSSNVEDAERIWNGEPSERHGFKYSDGPEGEHPDKNNGSVIGSQSTSSSVWGRIGNSGSKLDTTENPDATVAPTTSLINETKDQEEALSSVHVNPHQRKRLASEDAGSKALNSTVNSKVQNELARRNGRTSQKALRTLFVNGIPLKNNKRETLLSHFRKFGQIIDIYIPLNSEKAFVQFSKREEAEAALTAPDAVMGNRFIKLWWANRDSIPDNGLSTSHSMPAGPQGVEASVLPPPGSADKRKEILSPAVPSSSAAPLCDLPVATAAGYPLATNGPKVIPSQKKLDNLELLKEELRLKQELLDKKRNDFRRQLERLEKKSTAEPVAKKLKVGTRTDLMETSSSSSPIHPVRPATEKAVEKTHSGESVASPNSRKISTTTLQSPMSLKQPNRTSIPLGTNRFKLDNRPTTFKILPPIPDDFANVVTMKEHFSTYGDVSAVELEGPKTDSDSASSEPYGNCAATITFTTRRSAEIAFVNGKGWKGHNLKFSWVVVSSITNSNGGRENSPVDTPKGTEDADVQAETVGSGSLSITGESISSVPEVADSIENGEIESYNEVKDVSQPLHLLELCQSSGTPLSLSQTLSPTAGTQIVEDGVEVKSVP